MGSSRIRSDVFPATVSLMRSGGNSQPEVYDKVRVVTTLDTVYIFKDSANGPTLAFSERLLSYDPGVPVHRRTRATPARAPLMVTDSGIQLTVSRMSSCGCGSRLKSFDPFSSMTLASTRDR